MTRRGGPASEVLLSAGIVTRVLTAVIDFLVVLGLTALASAVAYLTVGWAVAGQTVGGAVLGVRVVALGGRRLGWLRSGLRAVLCVLVPLGLLWSAVSVNRRSVQDLLVGSAAVYDGH